MIMNIRVGCYITVWAPWIVGFLIVGLSNAATKSEKEERTTITCYECNSFYDPRCADPFDNFTIGTVNCSLKKKQDHLRDYEPTLCRKITQKVQGHIRVIRGCGYIPEEPETKQCFKRTGTHDVHVEYCSCKYDLCNSSKFLRSPPLLGLLLLAIFSATTTTTIMNRNS